VQLRLSDQLSFYANRTARLASQSSRWQLAAIVVGALGTLLAALGGDWVAWVALTSAAASALLAYVGYKQFDTTLTGYNQTATDLQNLQAWWTALLPDEQAQPENVDKLVTTTESVLATEQDGWAQNMTNALAALRTQQDDAAAKPASGG
jgi:SMODS and SLOG-associating 2TM effector domain 1